MSFLQTLQNIFSKSVLGAGENKIIKTSNPAYREWQERMEAILKPGKRSYFIRSLWHVECSRCNHYLYQSKEETLIEQTRLCVENYRVAFSGLKDCFDGRDKSGKPWKTKYPALLSNDNVHVIRTLEKKWTKMFPTLDMSPITEDLKFLIHADPYFHRACKSSNTHDPFVLENYQRVLKSLAKIASILEKPKVAELILLYVNEKTFCQEDNEPYTVTCWGEPAYAFLGGPLTEQQLTWMMFAVNIAHVPEKESDQIRYTHDDETVESPVVEENVAPS
ncbi:uncharacterized protein LOC130693877 [Daphnia carinata]|uniref:uncharacterized protein LOC130693877 n=1 Tax=Daphnia carinata TaxID=120202 RepID=UPI00257C1806|nr:uncharacterized protein LOC130693877 [Daphnia carinata]